jgi:hypothetical protein
VLAALACLLPLLGVPASAAPRWKPLRVHGEPVRAIALTELHQFSALSLADLDRLKADGFNTVTLYAYRFMTNEHSVSLHVSPFTEPDQLLAQTIDRAHALGLAVQLMPTVWVGDVGPLYWRGAISPSDRNAFFDSYRAMVDHYADLATEHHVEVLGLGSEMLSLENEVSQWQHTAASAREHYKGPLTYFAISQFAGAIRWWDQVDYPGISTYLSLSAAAQPSYAELLKAWRTTHLPVLRKLAAKVGRPLQLAEIGFASSQNAAVHPEDGGSGNVDERLQADLYRALLDGPVADPAFDGVSLWRWSAYETGPHNRGFSPKGKAAECVLAQRWNPGGASAVQCASYGRVLR